MCVFGIYDPDKDQLFTKCYDKKRSAQFVDFIKTIRKKYYAKLYIILDNSPIHVSKETKEKLKNIQGIEWVFLPYNSPDLNMIEKEYCNMQREAIDNRDFNTTDQIEESICEWVDYRNGKRKRIMR